MGWLWQAVLLEIADRTVLAHGYWRTAGFKGNQQNIRFIFANLNPLKEKKGGPLEKGGRPEFSSWNGGYLMYASVTYLLIILCVLK
jgi:hypothetical protein